MVISPTTFPRTLFAAETPEFVKEREIEAARRLRRMETLKRWTEQLLEKMHLREEADLFSFSCAPLDELSPTELFYGSHWYIPFSDTPRSLLPSGKDGGN